MNSRYLKILLVSIALLLAFESHAQKFKNSVYGEFFGNGIYYSVNYERNVFAQNKFFLSLSIGISTLGRSFTSIPILLHAYYGGPKHAIETAVGYTGLYREESMNFFNDDLNTYFTHFVTGRIGYRYESKTGFLFKLAFTPLYIFHSGDKNDYEPVPPNSWDDIRKFTPSFGISLGKSF